MRTLTRTPTRPAAQQFAERFDLGVKSPAEAVRGLAANLPGVCPLSTLVQAGGG
jgi:predicted phage tail protein